jgi:hypothetical protein
VRDDFKGRYKNMIPIINGASIKTRGPKMYPIKALRIMPKTKGIKEL